MSDDTRQARIAAGAQAIHAKVCTLWNDFSESWEDADDKHIYFAEAESCLDAADAIGRERVSAEMVNAAVEAFNAVTQQRTGKSLYGTWWPYEYLPAMKAALESALLTAAPAERDDETGEKP